MSNWNIKTDLLKLNGAFISNIKGSTAAKKCLCIPIEESGLFHGRQGCYLSLRAIEMKEPRYGDTHYLKVDLPKELRRTMTEEQLRAVPIIGGMHANRPLYGSEANTTSPSGNPSSGYADTADEWGDLPI